jgi:hypothetical protein
MASLVDMGTENPFVDLRIQSPAMGFIKSHLTNTSTINPTIPNKSHISSAQGSALSSHFEMLMLPP